MIIRNGVRHNTSSFGGSGNANIVKLTQSEYDALPESKKSDGILYAITDGECSASGGSSKPVELTREQYEALGDKVNSDGILYAITDGDGLTAKNMAFDDTETQLGVNNVQDAIVEQNKKKIYEYKGYSYADHNVTCKLDYNKVYLVTVQSLYPAGVVAIVQTGSKGGKITNIVESSYHTLSLDDNTSVLTLTSNGDGGYLYVTEIA